MKLLHINRDAQFKMKNGKLYFFDKNIVMENFQPVEFLYSADEKTNIFIIEEIQKFFNVLITPADKAWLQDFKIWFPLKSFGCYVCHHSHILIFFETAMLSDGKKDKSENEVTAPESQEFLDAVNDIFKTDYQLSQFAGR